MNTKEIASELQLRAADYPWHCPDSVRAVFSIDGLTIRCKANREAIERVADKYRKGSSRLGTYTKPRRTTTTRPKFSIRVLNDFMMSLEPDNAMQYIALYDMDQLTVKERQACTAARRLNHGT